MYKKKLYEVVAFCASFAVGTLGLEPAQAALLDFSFTTINGATGTFTLDTDTTPSPIPSIGAGIGGFPGILYPSAVSDFSFSSAQSPEFNLSNEIVDWEIIPGIIPGNMGNLSGVVSPSGCSTGTTFTCLINIGVLYTGNTSELSDNPDSYPVGLGIELFDPTNNNASLGIEPFSEYKVVQRETVPEPNTYLSIFALGIYGTASALKRKRSNLTDHISESRTE